MPDDGNGGEADRRIGLERLEPLSLAEALSVIGEETRVRIVIALGEARSVDPAAPNGLRFSELMDRLGIEDSGRLNYHLEKLVGPFVKKGDAGYALRLPGQLLYQAVVAGTLTDRPTVDPFTVGDCPDCDGRLSAAYHPDHLLTVECGGCATLYDAVHFPTRGLEGRSEAELLTAAYQRRHHEVATMRRGVCPGCGGFVARSLEPTASITYATDPVEELAGLEVYAVLACEACRASLVGHPANVALTTPTVVGFLEEHGHDAARAYWWDDPVAAARAGMDVADGPSTSVTVPFAVDGHRLDVTLDGELQVVHAERAGN